MCGIFGFVGSSDAGGRTDIDAVLTSLRHRGPDDQGTYAETFSIAGEGNQTCILAQTRLSVIDLSPAGHQPMASQDGRWRLVFNGEIYNHRELKADLEKDGERFVGSSDTEVVLHALARSGPRAVERFTGMFAFALWDRANASLMLARDRFGEKPLYVASCDRAGSFVFASEVRTLLASGLVERVASRRGLNAYLETGSVSEPWTVIRGAWAFPPATIVRVQRGAVTSDRFWHSPFHEKPSRTLGVGAALVRARLEQAVRGQLLADVPVGLFLSAGMDSTAIAATATKAQGGVRSFTVSVDDVAMDEGAVAARVARELGCEHHDVHVSSADAVTGVPEAVAALDQPSIDGVNSYLVSKAVRNTGTIVALSGVGGDEVFAGYRTFRTVRHWARLNRVVHSLCAGPATRWAARSPVPLPGSVRKALLIAGADGAAGEFYKAFRTLFSSDQIERLRPGPMDDPHVDETCPEWVDDRREPYREESGSVSAVSQTELDGYLRNTLLRDTDAMSMAHGLEVRAPFLDHHVVAAAASVWGRDRIAGPANKPLLAAAVSELPDVVTRRRKSGFGLPFDAWLRGPLRRWASTTLEDTGHGLTATEVRRIWSLFLDNHRHVSWSRAWALVVLASWLQRNRVTEAR